MDAPPTSIPGSTKLDTTDEADELDFAQELAKGMENLMRELSAEGSSGSRLTDNDESSDPSAESTRALKAVWEQMLVEGMDGDPGVSQNEASTGGGFQDKIKQAVNKLKESESSLQVNYNFSRLPPFTYKILLNRLIANLLMQQQHRMLNPSKLSLVPWVILVEVEVEVMRN